MFMKKHSFRPFRFLLYSAAVILILLILGGSAAGVKYLQTAKNPPPPVILEQPVCIPGGELTLGQVFRCQTRLRAPWGAVPERPDVTVPEGLQLLDDPVCEAAPWHWGNTVWTISLDLQAYRTGETGKGSLRFAVRQPDGSSVDFDLELPPRTVSEAAAEKRGDELDLAGELHAPEPDRRARYIFFGILGLLVIAAAFFALRRFFRRRKAEKALTVWDVALESIRLLRTMVDSGRESSEHAVALLTDIVRKFLETRYKLRAERQTTAEFLRDLERSSTLLPEEQSRFLRSFLESADMVKFARMPADRTLFENAAARAEKLVEGSRPADPGKKKEA